MESKPDKPVENLAKDFEEIQERLVAALLRLHGKDRRYLERRVAEVDAQLRMGQARGLQHFRDLVAKHLDTLPKVPDQRAAAAGDKP